MVHLEQSEGGIVGPPDGDASNAFPDLQPSEGDACRVFPVLRLTEAEVCKHFNFTEEDESNDFNSINRKANISSRLV